MLNAVPGMGNVPMEFHMVTISKRRAIFLLTIPQMVPQPGDVQHGVAEQDEDYLPRDGQPQGVFEATLAESFSFEDERRPARYGAYYGRSHECAEFHHQHEYDVAHGLASMG